MDQDEEDIIHRSASVKDRNRRRWLRLIGLVFVISLLGGGAAALATFLTLQSAAKDGTVLAQQIQRECDKPGITDPDLAQFCPRADEIVESAPETVKVEQVPGPPGETGEQGDTGAVGETGPPPSATQVLSAVRRFCVNTSRCDGTDGSDATPAQVAIAVSSYCNSRGECRGPAGEAGENGDDGVDGTAGKDGSNAPPVTQAQLIEAVDSYCAQNNNCRGPAGADGTNGSDGSTGPQGPAGPTGLVNVADNCEPAPEGQVINDVSSSYDTDTQTVMIDCTYVDVRPSVLQ